MRSATAGSTRRRRRSAFQWLRCNGFGDGCDEIAGADAREYTLVPADGTHTMNVRVTGHGAGFSTQLASPASYDVESAPAAIAPPLPPDEPGGPAKSQAPSLTGKPYVGQTLAGSVGGWVDPTTDFLRRWVRCDASGGACTYIQKPASTDLEDGPTYIVRAGDVGSRIRMRVTADVNNDLTPDGLDNHLPHAVEVDTPPTAVDHHRAARPARRRRAAATSPTRPGRCWAASRSRRRRSSRARPRPCASGRRRAARSASSLARKTTGRKVKGRCRPKTRKNRARKQCAFYKNVKSVTKAGVAPGRRRRALQDEEGQEEAAAGPLPRDRDRDRRGRQRLGAASRLVPDRATLRRRWASTATTSSRAA